MRRILPFILLCFTTNSFAQLVEVGLNVAPTISYRTADTRGLDDPFVSTTRVGEEPIYTFDFGFDFIYKLKERWMVGFGLRYSQKGLANRNVMATYNDFTLDEISHIDFVQDYIELPMFARRQVKDLGKFNFYGMLGLNHSFLITQKNNIILKPGAILESEINELQAPYLKNSSDYNFGLIGGVGFSVEIDERYNFALEPIAKYMISRLREKKFGTTRNLYSLGLNFKFVRKLNWKRPVPISRLKQL